MSSETMAAEQTLRVLCTLSDVAASVDVATLVHRVKDAPDAETAVQAVLNQLPLNSDVLRRKWRSTIEALWSTHHPHVPLLPALPLSSDDVLDTPLLQDAHAFLEAIRCQPAQLIEEHSELLLSSPDVWRIAAALPSMKLLPQQHVESEWAYVPLRRLRATLQALRVVRAVKGNLVVVRSRYERFRAFPPLQQFYVLWHADTYHVDWAQFAGLWGKFARVMQDYLPLLWDVGEKFEPGQLADRRQWCSDIIDTFVPLWEEEGLLDIGSGQAAILPIVQQHALPTILDRYLVNDMLVRHGLATVSEEFGQLSKFTWTKVGAHIFKAEASQELPCGLELLSDRSTVVLPDHNQRFT